MYSSTMAAMKAMKAKQISKIAKGVKSLHSVFSRRKTSTQGGLKESDLMRNKQGKIVTKAQYAAGKKAYYRIKGWVLAVKRARKDLGVKGFVVLKKSSALYKAAKAHYSGKVRDYKPAKAREGKLAARREKN